MKNYLLSRQVAGLALAALIILVTVLAFSYHDARTRLDRIAHASLMEAGKAVTLLRDAPVILENARRALEQFNCSPSMLKEEEPDTAVYYYLMIHLHGVYFEDLRGHVNTLYSANGLEMPSNLSLGLRRIADYFQDLAQDYYSATIVPW